MTDWQKILDEYSPLVWRIVNRLLRDSADAADCFQDVFVDAVRIARRESIENWPALLCRLATTRALDRLRQRYKKGQPSGVVVDWNSLEGSGPTPDEQAEARELCVLAGRLIAELPPREAEVFCLYSFECQSYEEISVQLRMSRNAVGVMLHKARRRLQAELKRTNRCVRK